MKTKKRFQFSLLFAVLSLFAACSDDDSDIDIDSDKTTNEALSKIINNYVDCTILPTYSNLKEQTWKLLEKVEQYSESGTQKDLNAACEAWKATREPWEESEAFLFGPVADQGLDPHLDSWPLDITNITGVLKSNIDLSSDNVRETLGQTSIGFHTLEYLLFENSAPKTASTVSNREKEYMVAVATILRDDALKLWTIWSGGKNASSRDEQMIEELEIDPIYADGFAEVFKNPAMITGARYKTQFDVIEQIIDGCVDIATEVGEQKIGGPWATKDVYAVESWYSWNSLEDYENNIISIENSYLGGPEENRDNATSLSAWVSSQTVNRNGSTINGSEIDDAIKTAIAETRKAINPTTGIPYPFRTRVEKGDNADKVEAAMNACSNLKDQLERVKTLL